MISEQTKKFIRVAIESDEKITKAERARIVTAMETQPRDERVTVKKAAELMAVSVPTIRKMIRDGRIRAIKIGERTVRLSRNEIEALCS